MQEGSETNSSGHSSRNRSAGPTKYHGSMDETRRQALARFLRTRREQLTPEQAGISSRRGRRTPGLRREEVAFLADIGVKWYARLEAGDDINPSTATLSGIAAALKLSQAELEYVLDLAGVSRVSNPHQNVEIGEQPVFGAFFRELRGVAATIYDRILTPFQWNALADEIYGYSRFADAVDRNSLVRSLRDPDFVDFLGPERDALVGRAVGMLRLNYTSPARSEFATRVFERVKDDELFQRFWSERLVATGLTDHASMVRHHPLLGRLEMYSIDFVVPDQPQLLVRIKIPSDEPTVAKFALLEERTRAAKEQPLNRDSLIYSMRDFESAKEAG